jgi:uncharacterized surface protein with fasciclin (FAS1) repeats
MLPELLLKSVLKKGNLMKKFGRILFLMTSLLFGFGNLSYADGHMPDLVETAIKAGKFKTLTAALGAAGLVETLKNKGPFTVFAPTDEAFAKIDSETLSDLLKPENREKLAAILTYHVVPGKIMSSDIRGDIKVNTASGKSISIKVASGKVTINDALVVATDIEADNGVIHIIDTVLLP